MIMGRMTHSSLQTFALDFFHCCHLQRLMAGAKKRAAMKDMSEGCKALAAGRMPAEVSAILKVNLPLQLVP